MFGLVRGSLGQFRAPYSRFTRWALIVCVLLSGVETLYADFPFYSSNYRNYSSDYENYRSRSFQEFTPVISLDLNKQDHLDCAFRIAIREDRIEDATALLDKGADPETPSERGETGLMYAARNCSVPAVGLILTREPKHVNSLDHLGRTALMYAAMQICDRVVDRLMEVPGVSVEAKDREGKTAWDYAKEGGALDVGGSAFRVLQRLSPSLNSSLNFPVNFPVNSPMNSPMNSSTSPPVRYARLQKAGVSFSGQKSP